MSQTDQSRAAGATTSAPAGRGFGATFTPHLISAGFRDGVWSDAVLGDFNDLAMSPAGMVLHYGQAIFEGLKAFRVDDHTVLIFRTADCATRFDRSAIRMGMPPLPAGVFTRAVTELVSADAADVPSEPGSSLYICPVMFADEPSLAVRPSTRYRLLIMASPVDSFFAPGPDHTARTMIDAYAQRSQIRAAVGGTGDVKCAGNYAGAMAAKTAAQARGCDEVLWLDAVEHRFIEEFGAMNCFVVQGSGATAELITPPLTGTILPGNTRATVIELARRRGMTVREQPTALDDIMAAESSITEVFACGTAAGVAPVRMITTDSGQSRTIGDQPGPITAQLAADYTALVHGNLAPEPGWIIRITH